MEKKQKKYNPNNCTSFEMNFGFPYPVARYSEKRIDTRTKEHGKQRVELNKKNK